MPRPKPPEKLIVRSVRLSNTQWAAFDAMGGSAWLRSRIDKLNMAGIAKRQRNNRIRAAARAASSQAEVARQLGVSTATVSRVLK